MLCRACGQEQKPDILVCMSVIAQVSAELYELPFIANLKA